MELVALQLPRPPTPNFADYPIRVDGMTIYDPKHDPQFPILTERLLQLTISYLTNVKKQNLKDSKLLI